MITCEEGRCRVDGPLTMQNVTSLAAEGAHLFSVADVVVDLAAVTEVDSSAVSLLLEWQRQARAAGRRLEFVHVPANLRSLADLYGVSALLDGQASA